jgi:hypothetical protein
MAFKYLNNFSCLKIPQINIIIFASAYLIIINNINKKEKIFVTLVGFFNSNKLINSKLKKNVMHIIIITIHLPPETLKFAKIL